MRRHYALFITTLVPVVVWAQGRGSTIATEAIFDALRLRAGATVCEIGAGDGALSIAAARIVGANGHVYTSELGEDRVASLRKHVADSGLPQITVVAGEAAKTNFAGEQCDALFMRNVYHHFADPLAMNASIAAALKPGGRVAVIDFAPSSGKEAAQPADRDESSTHGVSADSVSRELKEAGFAPVASEQGTQRWFMIVASKPN